MLNRKYWKNSVPAKQSSREKFQTLQKDKKKISSIKLFQQFQIRSISSDGNDPTSDTIRRDFPSGFKNNSESGSRYLILVHIKTFL